MKLNYFRCSQKNELFKIKNEFLKYLYKIK